MINELVSMKAFESFALLQINVTRWSIVHKVI